MSFTALLAELDELKSLKKSITEDASVQIDTEQEPEEELEPLEDEEGLGKSINFTDEDGTVTEAIDGTELVKSLTARLDKQESDFTEHTDGLMKSFESLTSLIKSLQEQVNDLSTSGRGRKSVLTVAEKPEATLQKSEPDGMSPDEFMAKAMQANKEGRISSVDVCTIEGYLTSGLAVAESLVRKVLI